MPLGSLMDQIEIYKQWNGITQPKKYLTIDDIIPEGV